MSELNHEFFCQEGGADASPLESLHLNMGARDHSIWDWDPNGTFSDRNPHFKLNGGGCARSPRSFGELGRR